MGQVKRKLIMISVLFIIIFPSWALADEGIEMSKSFDKLTNLIEYSGEFDSNLKEELINNNSPSIQYDGTIFTEADKDYTYFLWNTTAKITSNINTSNITIQLKDDNYDNGYLQLYVDNYYLGEISAKSDSSKYIQITNLPYLKHTITLKQRGGHIHFDWIGFGDKKGDINPPSTRVVYSPELVNGIGGQDTELSFFIEDDISEEIEPSGIEKTLYSIDGSGWSEYMGPFNLKEGEHQIRYFSVDNNKNNEDIRSSNIIVRNNTPVIAYK